MYISKHNAMDISQFFSNSEEKHFSLSDDSMLFEKNVVVANNIEVLEMYRKNFNHNTVFV